jgi:hypothetical protein
MDRIAMDKKLDRADRVIKAAIRLDSLCQALLSVRGWEWSYDDIHVYLKDLHAALEEYEQANWPDSQSER